MTIEHEAAKNLPISQLNPTMEASHARIPAIQTLAALLALLCRRRL